MHRIYIKVVTFAVELVSEKKNGSVPFSVQLAAALETLAVRAMPALGLVVTCCPSILCVRAQLVSTVGVISFECAPWIMLAR